MTVKGIFVAMLLQAATMFNIFGQIGIGTSTPSDHAILHVDGNGIRGLLPPVTTDKSTMEGMDDGSIDDAMIVYDNTSRRLFIYSKSENEWHAVNAWKAPDGANILYTTDKVGIGTSTPEKQFDVQGDALVSGSVTAKKFSGEGIVPPGGIIMFTGNTAGKFSTSGLGIAGTEYEGWAICNGSNSTPDLRNRFIVSTGSSYAMGARGGANTYRLSVDQLPAHTHELDLRTQNSDPDEPGVESAAGTKVHASGGTNHTGAPHFTIDLTSTTIYSGQLLTETHQHEISGSTESTGSGEEIENRPLYYALAFIMKLQ